MRSAAPIYHFLFLISHLFCGGFEFLILTIFQKMSRTQKGFIRALNQEVRVLSSN